MKLLAVKFLSLGAVAFVLGTSAAMAGAADDAIKGRQACMKAHGGVMGVAVPIMKGEKPFDAATLKAAYDKEDAACAGWDSFWDPKNQDGATIKTRAKPEIWTDRAGFDAAAGTWYQAAQILRAATDEATFKAAFPAVGAGCQGCHEKFRAPE